jgi:guanylate kinase
MQPIVDNICGHVIVVMAPTGSGKGTIVKHALEKFPELKHTISCTSRTMRPREINGKHYFFVSSEVFDEKVAQGEFLEWAVFAGNKYGTLKSEILPRLVQGEVVIVEIELQGVEQLLTLIPREHLTVVYIEAGGWEVLKARAEARSPMSETELHARYERYLVEQQAKSLADVIIDNSGDITVAYAQFEHVIADVANKCKL